MLGLKEIVMIAGVILVLYGRGGSRLLRSTRYGRTIDPWLNLVRVAPKTQGNGRRPSVASEPPAPVHRQGRVFWALALTAAAAVAAWVATRVIIVSGPGATH